MLPIAMRSKLQGSSMAMAMVVMEMAWWWCGGTSWWWKWRWRRCVEVGCEWLGVSSPGGVSSPYMAEATELGFRGSSFGNWLWTLWWFLVGWIWRCLWHLVRWLVRSVLTVPLVVKCSARASLNGFLILIFSFLLTLISSDFLSNICNKNNDKEICK